MNAEDAANAILKMADYHSPHPPTVREIIHAVARQAKQEALEGAAKWYDRASAFAMRVYGGRMPDVNPIIAEQLRRMADKIGKDATDGE